MQDAKLILEIKNNKVECWSENISIEQLAFLSGWLQTTVALKAFQAGGDIEEIKTASLGLHFDAMEIAENQMKRR